MLVTVAFAALLIGLSTLACATIVDRAVDKYDYIIVGGGTSGCVAAARLTEDADVSVLVIEAGLILTDEKDPDYMDLIIYPTFETRPTYLQQWMWPNMTTEPIPELNGRTSGMSLAKIAGGGSAINGRTHVRGAARDYDDWARYLDDDAWGWQGMLPYFKKSETFTPPMEAYQAQANASWDMRYHGKDGPISVTWPPAFFERARYSVAAEKTLGIPYKGDQGSGDIVGGIWHPMASRSTDFTRSYSKREYLEPAMKRDNLHFLAETTVTRILFDGKRAIGVEYSSGPDAPVKEVHTRRKGEVVLAGGPTKSPQLLQVSGIGPKSLSKLLGIPGIVDLPVGENYQDHGGANLNYNLSLPVDEVEWINKGTNKTWYDEQLSLYVNEGKGWLTATSDNRMILLSASMLHGEATKSILSEYKKGDAMQYLRDGVHSDFAPAYKMQHELLLASMGTDELAVQESQQLGMRNLLVKPLSRGYIEAKTASIWDPPSIHLRTLAHPLDLQNVMASLRFGRKLLATPDVAALEPVETAPGLDAVQTDEELEAYVRETMSAGGAHGCCAAAMGTVLDSKMRVKGVKRLRVIDTSSWPMIPGSHALLSTAYAVAEKAADLIKEERDRSRT